MDDHSHSKSLRLLVIRSDRIGDGVLSTPVLEVLKKTYPHAHIYFFIQKALFPIVHRLPSIHSCLIFDPDGVHAGLRGWWTLSQDLRKKNIQIAIGLHTHWKIAFALLFARIPVRIGPWSKWYSFLVYNRGMRQRRSQVKMHEVQYNLQLLSLLGISIPSNSLCPKIALPPDSKKRALRWLETRLDLKKGFILIHPGMRHSALNLPEAHYKSLIEDILQNAIQVLITAGDWDQEFIRRLKTQLPQNLERLVFYESYLQPKEQQNIDFWSGLCFFSKIVIAPSTGPLHIAVALQKPVISFYPHILVQSKKRWGPYRFDDSVHVFEPPTTEDGMEKISIASILNSVYTQWGKSHAKKNAP